MSTAMSSPMPLVPKMDPASLKKREADKVECTDMHPHQIKRTKKVATRHSEYILMFLKALSLLSEEKKIIVRTLGFGSLLNFYCASNINRIFEWLMHHFNTNTATINLENGFTFTRSPIIVHKLLGVPLGGMNVSMNPSKEACDFIHNLVHMESPTVEYLCTILTNELHEEEFPVVFMMATLSAFIAPNGRGVASTKFYQSLIKVSEIPNYDWSAFALNWLLLYISKHKTKKVQRIGHEIGGCKMILVIPYFEFLITSEFNHGTSIPRLPLWTTHIVNSYIALDSMYGSERKFGRLPRKHMSSTVFQGCSDDSQYALPAEVREHIALMFRNANSFQVKTYLEDLSLKFFNNLVQNSIPTVNSYIDDLSKLCQIDTQEDPDSDCEDNRSVSLQVQIDFMEKMLQLEKSLNSPGKLNYDSNELSTDHVFQQLVNSFAKSCTVDDLNLQPKDHEFEQSLIDELVGTKDVILVETSDPTFTISECVLQFHKVFGQEHHNINTANDVHSHHNYKFSLSKMEFLGPGKNITGEDLEFNMNLISSNENKQSDVYSYPDENKNAAEHLLTPDMNDGSSTRMQTHRGTVSNNWGLSLNERLLGVRNTSTNTEVDVSFELLDEDDLLNWQTETVVPSTKEYKDPQVKACVDQVPKESVEAGRSNFRRLNEEFLSTSPIALVADVHPRQLILATSFEHEFYYALTSSNLESSPRIFCIKKFWVDQKTLTLSMSPGGWIHPHVMDCSGMLTLTEQLKSRKDGHVRPNEILKHIVIKDVTKILMNRSLNHTDPGYKILFGTNNVGFRLESAGLVHIPCPFDKQWILIVANFYDKTFDILNPDYSFEKVSSIVSTVTFNFNKLFAANFPGCRFFNILDFQVRHIKVPKHNFRYDSGIFVMQLIRWYNGAEVQPFSNVDVQPIREKITCQLVINNFNELQAPITSQFLAKNAPHLLR